MFSRVLSRAFRCVVPGCDLRLLCLLLAHFCMRNHSRVLYASQEIQKSRATRLCRNSLHTFNSCARLEWSGKASCLWSATYSKSPRYMRQQCREPQKNLFETILSIGNSRFRVTYQIPTVYSKLSAECRAFACKAIIRRGSLYEWTLTLTYLPLLYWSMRWNTQRQFSLLQSRVVWRESAFSSLLTTLMTWKWWNMK